MDRTGHPLARLLKGWLWLPLLGFLILFFFYPLASILTVSLTNGGTLDLSGFIEIASRPYFRDVFVFTLGQAVLSTVLTLALALPGAYIYTRYRFPGRTLFATVAGLPFVLPTVVVAAGYLALIGPRGLLNQALMNLFGLEAPPIVLDRTLTIILIAHVFYNYGVAFRLISAYWANRSTRMEDAARMLGAHGWRLWWSVRLPLLRPALFAAGVLVFIYTFTSFGIIVILGGPRFSTLEVEIYRQIANLFDLPTAAALSLAQIAFMFTAIAVYTRLERVTTVPLQRGEQRLRPPRTLRERLAVWGNILFVVVFLVAPLAALVMRSFIGPEGQFTLAYYTGLGSNPRGSVLNAPPTAAISNSLVIALAATALALLLGALAARQLSRRGASAGWFDALFMLPLATSAVVLGFGYNIALDEPPLNLRSSPLLVPLAHALVGLPFVLRGVAPALRAIPAHVEESAQTLGANGWRLFRYIQLPLISRALAASGVFAFTISLGEFGATLFVARPNAPTLPIAIFRLLGQPGEINYGRAVALSTLLLLICALAFWLIERLQRRSAGGL